MEYDLNMNILPLFADYWLIQNPCALILLLTFFIIIGICIYFFKVSLF